MRKIMEARISMPPVKRDWGPTNESRVMRRLPVLQALSVETWLDDFRWVVYGRV